jgi:hypothetical protein
VVSDSQNGLGKKNKLEKGFDGDKTLSPGQDEVSTTTSPTTIEYWLTTNVADDGFITSWEIVEDCIGICGVKFGDTNQNGEQDEEESNLSGWEIELFDIEHSTSTPIMTTATTEGGYCFTDIEEGTYVVSEVMQSGWASTTPDSVEVYFSGEERLTVDFGNFQATSSIHGLKYHDEDGDGERDEGEAGLAGWVIVLSSQEEVVATTTTMEGGEYWFTDLAPGEYTVSEEAQLGWGQTQPSEGASYEVTLGLGETLEDLIFGNEEVPLPECSDGIDNDEDEYTDEDDPACHTDGNPENPESFNPTGDETDLNITNEDNGEAGDDSITVVWDTNKPATSRVVYGTTSVPTLGDAPNYGYPFSTIEDPTLVESHSVLISELETDVTYYWRAISSASPEVVGEELTFSISSDDGGDDNGEGGSPFVSPPTGDGGGGTSPYIYGQGGGGGGTIPASLFTPTTPTETGGTPNPVIAQITTPIPTTSTGGGEVGDGTVIGAGETDIEPISDITEGQLAGVGFLGFVYECGPGTTLLTLIILLIIAIYVYKRHDKIWEALIGIIVGAIILWFIGAYNCNWLLVVLALLIIMLIGWDLRQNKEK